MKSSQITSSDFPENETIPIPFVADMSFRRQLFATLRWVCQQMPEKIPFETFQEMVGFLWQVKDKPITHYDYASLRNYFRQYFNVSRDEVSISSKNNSQAENVDLPRGNRLLQHLRRKQMIPSVE